jgi:hypothetical protein
LSTTVDITVIISLSTKRCLDDHPSLAQYSVADLLSIVVNSAVMLLPTPLKRRLGGHLPPAINKIASSIRDYYLIS